MSRMTLFQAGDFTLRSGRKSGWKIECDALTPQDWEGLARIAHEILPPFGAVVGVPRGGIPFSDALSRYITVGCNTLLVAEDVCTTGGSMERFLDNPLISSWDRKDIRGVCVFCRGACPLWVTPLFHMPLEKCLIDMMRAP